MQSLTYISKAIGGSAAAGKLGGNLPELLERLDAPSQRARISPLRMALLASAAIVFAAGCGPADAAAKKSNLVQARDFGSMPKGPLQLVVSIANQHVTLYSNGVRVAQGPVSTGIPGKPTPTGVFSVIQKDRYHHSNLYSNAPMPYMQRITWSGVALHEGPLPGYPASHGCIRMTHDFAARLWLVTSLGVRVIVARSEVVPVEFAHPRLFVPRTRPAVVAGSDPARDIAVDLPTRFARMAATATSDAAPAAGATPSAPQAATPSEPAPRFGTAPTEAGPILAVPLPDPPKPSAQATDPLKLPPPATRSTAPLPVKHLGKLAVFVSRKEKKLYVRQGMVPLFDVPVEIERPDQPLGTHVFTALSLTDEGAGMRWNVMSMPGEQPRLLAPRMKGQREPVSSKPALAPAPSTAAQALDRIQIPPEAVERIEELLVPGSSLLISDQGLGGETGEGTDFIVLTH
jgi:L,D-transpeptidase-like protein